MKYFAFLILVILSSSITHAVSFECSNTVINDFFGEEVLRGKMVVTIGQQKGELRFDGAWVNAEPRKIESKDCELYQVQGGDGVEVLCYREGTDIDEDFPMKGTIIAVNFNMIKKKGIVTIYDEDLIGVTRNCIENSSY